MSESKIEWTGRSDWNPIRGCTRKSLGCVNCYAEIMAARFSQPGQWGEGYAHIVDTPQGKDHRWTGKVEVMYDRLELPLAWRNPTMLFASSTSDVFHEALALHDIAMIYAVAVAAHHLRGHITQILTKRSDRMAELLNSEEFWDIVNGRAGAIVMDRTDPLDRRSDDARATLEDYGPDQPPPGIWLGISVEDRTNMLARAGHLKASPAQVRWWSAEPLIGDLGEIPAELMPDWIVVGGESGPGARPMLPDWARDLRDQCEERSVPFFFKQWGEWAPGECASGPPKRTETGASWFAGEWLFEPITVKASEELHCDDAPDLYRLGKKQAGRMLDGVIHDGYPS